MKVVRDIVDGALIGLVTWPIQSKGGWIDWVIVTMALCVIHTIIVTMAED